jgi:hypothetical protein
MAATPIKPYRLINSGMLPTNISSKFRVSWMPILKLMTSGHTKVPRRFETKNNKIPSASYSRYTGRIRIESPNRRIVKRTSRQQQRLGSRLTGLPLVDFALQASVTRDSSSPESSFTPQTTNQEAKDTRSGRKNRKPEKR